MKTTQKSDKLAANVMNALRSYGQEFLIFAPEDQPNVFKHDAYPVPRELKSGRLNPKALKHWSFVDMTRDLLRHRYGLLSGTELVSDCPLPDMAEGEPLPQAQARKTLRLIIYGGMIGFLCSNASFCAHPFCHLKEKKVIDIYDLIALLDGKSLIHARRVVAKHFGVDLGAFPKATAHEAETAQDNVTNEGRVLKQRKRRAVPKAELTKLFAAPTKGKDAGARFAAKAVQLILSSPLVAYDSHHSDSGDSFLLSKKFDWASEMPSLGAASRLFLWVHVRQAEEGRRLKATVREVAKALGLERRTIQMHKKQLVDLGYLEVDEKNGFWTAKYERINYDI